ncbi:hypothetical protein PV377_21190 [Streptomyces ipomoeae]|uniref:hypothetical protein n=1 Tax=Streptomyces ipomoeae TaxID=103232 RepID=UPI0029BC9DBE|nr:hypothetical protein [Streptomyces ipomoeae]MDX2841456.1 hypothetical protein [Streptomyces ipomoeae]
MFGLITRRRHNAELAAIRSYCDALRERCETAEKNEATERVARQTITRQHAELDAANRRLEGRVAELTKRIEERPSFEDSATLRNQIRHLQRQLDDAVGLPPGRIEDSSRWQPGYKAPKAGEAS